MGIKLSDDETFVLEYLGRGNKIDVVPDDMRGRFTPETLQFTLAQLQAKGLIEYMEGMGYSPTEKAQEYVRKKEVLREKINAWGHPDITASHTSIIEIIKNKELPKDNNSVIAVGANKACADLNEAFKNNLKMGKEMKVKISVDGREDVVLAKGSPVLELSDKNCMIIRKSNFVDSRTLAISANKSAHELDEKLKARLKNRRNRVKITLEI